ncbi:MAG: HlyD family type I secretion periplasmic adaptor subunit [Vicinamibacterales bacterium]
MVDRLKAWLGAQRARLATLLMREERETAFLPAALEIIETPASPAGRATAATIIGFFLMALLWACFGSVDIIAVAPGKVVSTGRTKIVQPLETGSVRAIHVRDGQAVKAGDVLIEIDSTISGSERDRIAKESVQAALEVARLKAVLAASDDPLSAFGAPAGASGEQIELQRRLLANEVEEQRARLSALDRQIAQGEANAEAVAGTVIKLSKVLPNLRERAGMHEVLLKKGLATKLAALNARQEVIEQEQELEVQRRRLSEAQEGVSSLKEQREQAQAQAQREWRARLAETEQKAASLSEGLRQATQRAALQTLTSPVDGTVQQLIVHTEGGVVTPAQALLAVVPADAPLEIEAFVTNRDIGFVRAGQAAEVKIDTFNFTRYGLVHGTVESVSQDAIVREAKVAGGADHDARAADSSTPIGQELVYGARVRLGQTEMRIDDRMVRLSPGMAVTVEIKTGQRQVIDYLLSPLARTTQEALRER